MVEWRVPWFLLALVFWMFARVDSALARPAGLDTTPIVLNADLISYSTAEGRVTAIGNVELHQDGRTLLTDRIAYDIEAGTVAATHQDLAAHIGSAREVVSRRLVAMADKDLIALERGHILVKDRPALEALSREY